MFTLCITNTKGAWPEGHVAASLHTNNNIFSFWRPAIQWSNGECSLAKLWSTEKKSYCITKLWSTEEIMIHSQMMIHWSTEKIIHSQIMIHSQIKMPARLRFSLFFDSITLPLNFNVSSFHFDKKPTFGNLGTA